MVITGKIVLGTGTTKHTLPMQYNDIRSIINKEKYSLRTLNIDIYPWRFKTTSTNILNVYSKWDPNLQYTKNGYSSINIVPITNIKYKYHVYDVIIPKGFIYEIKYNNTHIIEIITEKLIGVESGTILSFNVDEKYINIYHSYNIFNTIYNKLITTYKEVYTWLSNIIKLLKQ